MSEIERGYKYHANFIYNQPIIKTKSHKNKDHTTSLDIVEMAVDKMSSWGFRKTYYHDRDALPGTNVFTEFLNTVKQSGFTIVVVTREFIDDSWNLYKSQSAFLKSLKKDKSSKFIAIYVDLNECHIPEEFSVMEPMYFDNNWRCNHQVWERLRLKLINQFGTPVQDTGRDPYPGPSIRNNPVSGVQDTNPPHFPRNMNRGNSIETDAPDSLQSHHTASSSTQNVVLPEAQSTTTNHLFASSIGRQPPDGAPVPSDSTTQSQTNNDQLQSYDSNTELKEVNQNGSGNQEDEVPFSSLNEQDVEVDTNQNNTRRHLNHSETDCSLERRTRTGHTANRPYDSGLDIHSPEPQSFLDRLRSFDSRRFVAGVFLGSLINIYRSDQSFK